MKPRPRIRKMIKWGGAAVTVLLVVVWIGSSWCWMRLAAPSGRQWRLDQGAVVCDPPGGGIATSWIPGGGWSFDVSRQPTGDGNQKVRLSLGGRRILIAPFAMLAGAVAAAAWRFDVLARRGRRNVCSKCGYDRAGIGEGAVCPECGAIPKVG
jgi:hypothetical protein